MCIPSINYGIHGNEKVHRLAKRAATRVAPSTTIPFHDLYSSIRVAVLGSWQGRQEDVAATNKMGEITSVTFRP